VAGRMTPSHGSSEGIAARWRPLLPFGIAGVQRSARATPQAIASLQDQSHQAWRAYIVDDGDGDGVRAASLAADHRVVAFDNPGHGQVEARNAALRSADGDIVMLLGGDVLLDPDSMGKVVRRLASGPALVRRSGWLLFAEDGRDTDRQPFRLRADPESLRRDNTFLPCGLAWPRTLHDRLGAFDPTVGSHDSDWILRILSAGPPLAEVSGLGVGYRVHDGTASTHRTAWRTGFSRAQRPGGSDRSGREDRRAHVTRALQRGPDAWTPPRTTSRPRPCDRGPARPLQERLHLEPRPCRDGPPAARRSRAAPAGSAPKIRKPGLQRLDAGHGHERLHAVTTDVWHGAPKQAHRPQHVPVVVVAPGVERTVGEVPRTVLHRRRSSRRGRAGQAESGSARACRFVVRG